MNQAGALVGLILAAVLAGVAFLAPQMFPSRPAATTTAEEQATLATRQLFRYSQNSADLKRAADFAALEGADLDKLVQRSDGSDPAAKTPFDILNEQFAETIQTLRAADSARKERGVVASEVRPPALDASGVRASAAATAKWVDENEKLLAAAEKAASDAARADRTVRGATEPLGTALLIRASEALGIASRLRREADDRRRFLLAQALEWKLANLDTQAAIETSPATAIEALRTGLAELQAEKAKVDEKVAELSAKISEREKELGPLTELLTANRKKLVALETAGFKAGNDASFESYRASYRAISEELAVLDERQEQLLNGGHKGATIADDDYLTGAIEGGEALEGLEDLRRELAIYTGAPDAGQGVAEQLAAGIAAVENEIAMLGKTGEGAQQRKARGEAALAALEASIGTLMAETVALMLEADGYEKTAIEASQKAATAFADAQQAVQQYRSAASTVQSEHDPNRLNVRLARIQSDANAVQNSTSGEVAARFVEARTHALRIRSAEAHLRALDEVRALVGRGDVKDRADLESYVTSAREAGKSAIEKAQKLCEDVLGKSGNTGWIGQGLLAAAHLILADIDAAQAAKHRERAIETLDAAVKTREKSPYVEQLVRLREMLKPAGG